MLLNEIGRGTKERKEKQEEKAKTAKANQLKYGANIVKFEPPANKGG